MDMAWANCLLNGFGFQDDHRPLGYYLLLGAMDGSVGLCWPARRNFMNPANPTSSVHYDFDPQGKVKEAR